MLPQNQQSEEGNANWRVQRIANGDAQPEHIVEDNLSLRKFSLKFEDMPSNMPRRSTSGWRKCFRRSRPQPQQKRGPIHKTYSQYNLTQLSNTVVDDSHHETLEGIYDLLARQIEVPSTIMEKLQPGKGAEPPIVQCALNRKRRRSIFGLPLLHPYSRFAVAWRFAILVFDLSFTAFWVPLNVGFCFSSYGDLSRSCTRSDLAGGIVYVINWIVGFQMGVVAISGSHRVVVQDGMSVARIYILYGKFLIDTLAALPFFILVSVIAARQDDAGGDHGLWSLLSLLRLVRLLRLFKTVKVVYKDSLNGSYQLSWVAERISVPLMSLLILGYQFLLVVNLCASLMVLLSTYYGDNNLSTWFDGMSWVNFETASPPVLWFHSAYWVITVLTTTGQGQAPRRLGEQIVSNFCSVYGMVFNGLVVGVVGEALMRASGDASALLRSRRNVARATNWADMRQLGFNLTRDLQVFFSDSELVHREAHLARRHFHKEASYIEELPTSLRRKVLQHIVTPLLDTVHIFSRLDREYRELLASMFRPVDVPPNHDLCRQGTAADRLWLVEWGTVIALRHKEAEAHPTTGMACLLGETVILRGIMDAAAIRPWTFRTTSVCRLWELHWVDLEKLVRVDASLVATTLQYVKERLILKLDGVPERDYNWCELLVILGRILQQPALLGCARDNLAALVETRVDDGSLPLLLSSWLEAGIATALKLGLEPNAGGKRGLVTMSQMLARQSSEMSGPVASVNLSGAGFQYPLGVSSPAIMTRYGASRGGGESGGGGGSTAAVSAGGDGVANSRGPLNGGGGASGLPASPLAIASAASPAFLRQETSGGVGDTMNMTTCSPGASGELPRGSFPGGGGVVVVDDGKTSGSTSGVLALTKRSQSFAFGDHQAANGADGSKVTGVTGAGAGAGAAAAAARVLTHARTQPQLTGLSGASSCGGGMMSSSRVSLPLSRFASAVPARPSASVKGSATAAAAEALQSWHGKHRGSMSENGVTAASCGNGNNGELWGTAMEMEGARAEGDIAAVTAEMEHSCLSVIAQTPLAYAMVDAGGVPMLPHHPRHEQRQEHLVQQLQQQGRCLERDELEQPPAGCLQQTQSSPLVHGLRSGPLIFPVSEDSETSDMPQYSPQHSPRRGQAAAYGTASASAAAPWLLARGSCGASPRADLSGGDSPRGPLAGDRSPKGILSNSGGGSLPLGGTSAGGARASSRMSLMRTRSAHMLPLVPEEDGIMRSSSEGTGTGSGGGGDSRGGSGGGADGVAAPLAAGPAARVVDGRAPFPMTAVALLRRAVTVSGFTGARAGLSGAASSSSPEQTQRHGVPRSRSAFLVRSQPSSPPVAAELRSVKRVGEEGTASGIGVRNADDNTSLLDLSGSTTIATAAAAAAAARERTADCPASEGQQGTTLRRVIPTVQKPLSQRDQQSDGNGGASAGTDATHSPLSLCSQVSAVSPVAGIMTTSTPVAAVGNVSSSQVSEHLLQVPMPERVSRLRVRTGKAPLTACRPLPVGYGDAATHGTGLAAGHPLPSALAAAPMAGPCPAPTMCTTCGKCTCASCRARVMATALAVEQGAATVVTVVTTANRVPPLPYSSRPSVVGPIAGLPPPISAVCTSQAPIDSARGVAGATAGAGAPNGNGGAEGRIQRGAAISWAQGAGGSPSRGPETWRRRRASMLLDLGKNSLPLVPF